MARGLILFAHGSREPGWAEPFEQLAARVRVAAPQPATGARRLTGPLAPPA